MERKKTNTALGVLAVAGAAVGAYFLFGRSANAAEPAKPSPGPSPTPPGPGPVKPSGGSKKRPSGDPPPYGHACFPPEFGGSNAYDQQYWDAGDTAEERERIFEAFDILGYATPTDRNTMNAVGPDGKLGGGDDIPNPEVRRFQADYNAVSRKGNFLPSMGGLDTDGKVGPCTLNALHLVILEQERRFDVNPKAKIWRELVEAAR